MAVKYSLACTTNPMVMAMLVGDCAGKIAVLHIAGSDGDLGNECYAVAESQ